MKHGLSIALAIAGLGLAACEKPREPGVYDLSITEAYQRLATNALPDLVYRRQCGILIHVTPTGWQGNEVTWRVQSSGREVAKFTALLTAVGDKQTKVEIKLPAGEKGGEIYDGSEFYRRPAFNSPLRPAVEEQISALLEGRPMDITRVGQGKDTVCNVQRGGLESGMHFSVNDPPDT